jgi:hypothetical protein
MRPLLLMCVCATTARAEPVDLGASVSVQVEPNGDTTVDVKRGELKVKAGGRETRVRAGEMVRAQKGKPLKRLLPAPAMTAPADAATVATLDLAFGWQKVPGAARYLLEVAAAPELSSAQLHTVDGTRAVVHLEPGTWYWRVTALDGEGTPGKRAPARRLTIDTTPPTLKTGKPQWR